MNELEPHDWWCVRWKLVSPGLYDALYKCQKCGKTYMESTDNFKSKRPTFGCPNTILKQEDPNDA